MTTEWSAVRDGLAQARENLPHPRGWGPGAEVRVVRWELQRLGSVGTRGAAEVGAEIGVSQCSAEEVENPRQPEYIRISG